MDEWCIQAVSLVWFWGNGQAVSAETPFEAVFGLAPDNLVRNKVPHTVTGVLSQASLAADGRGYIATVQPGRLELTIACPDDGTGPAGWGLSAGMDVTTELASAFAASTVNVIDAASRIACHVRMMAPMATANDAGRYLLGRVGLDGALPNALDFEFQVNERMASREVTGILINRVMKFSVGVMQEITFQPSNPQLGSDQAVTTIDRYFANLLLDLNNVPGGGRELTGTEQRGLFLEMAAEANRLASKGTVGALNEPQ